MPRECLQQVAGLGVEASDDTVTAAGDHQALVKFNHGDGHGVTLVGDGVVTELGDPAFGGSVL